MARTKYYHADEVAELLGITIDEVRVMLKIKNWRDTSWEEDGLLTWSNRVLKNLSAMIQLPKSKNQSSGTSRMKNMRRCMSSQMTNKYFVYVICDCTIKYIIYEFAFQCIINNHNSVYLSDFPLAFSTGYLAVFLANFSITISLTSNWYLSAIKNA